MIFVYYVKLKPAIVEYNNFKFLIINTKIRKKNQQMTFPPTSISKSIRYWKFCWYSIIKKKKTIVNGHFDVCDCRHYIYNWKEYKKANFVYLSCQLHAISFVRVLSTVATPRVTVTNLALWLSFCTQDDDTNIFEKSGHDIFILTQLSDNCRVLLKNGWKNWGRFRSVLWFA